MCPSPTYPSKELCHRTSLAILKAVAVGDSLGLPLEGLNQEEVRRRFTIPVTELQPIRNVPFFPGDHPQGTISDDTYLTIASFKAFAGNIFSMEKVASCLIAAYDYGVEHTPGTPHPLGWGWSVGDAILRLKQGVHWSEAGVGKQDNRGYGNGVLIRIAPLALHFWEQGEQLPLSDDTREYVNAFTAITHPRKTSCLASLIFVSSMLYCLQNDLQSFSREALRKCILDELLIHNTQQNTTLYSRLTRLCTDNNIHDLITRCCLNGTPSHVECSLPLVLSHAFLDLSSFDPLYQLISLGEDADSNGSMFAALYAALHKNSDAYDHHFHDLIERDWILEQLPFDPPLSENQEEY